MTKLVAGNSSTVLSTCPGYPGPMCSQTYSIQGYALSPTSRNFPEKRNVLTIHCLDSYTPTYIPSKATTQHSLRNPNDVSHSLCAQPSGSPQDTNRLPKFCFLLFTPPWLRFRPSTRTCGSSALIAILPKPQTRSETGSKRHWGNNCRRETCSRH